MAEETRRGAPAGGEPTLVLAGASNLHLGILPVAAALDRALGARGLLIVAAPGAGRSYAKPAGALGITYPGLLESGLVEYAAAHVGGARSGPRLALLMDIGNDLGYGESPRQVLAWVAELKTKLVDLGFPVVIQRPPVASVARLPQGRFRVIRRLYFPDNQLSRDELLARVREVDDGLLTLVDGDCGLVPSLSPHAGPDGIHARPWSLPAFWNGVIRDLVARLGYPGLEVALGSRTASLAHGLLSRRLKPRRWARAGRWMENANNETRLPAGATLVRL